MPLLVQLRLCIGGVFCCSLLALYLLWLATLHRRHRPTVVSGELDFVATLVGLGGFWIVGGAAATVLGPALFASRPSTGFETTWWRVGAEPQAWVWSLALYSVVVTAVAVIELWLRRDTLEVHHIDPTEVVPAVDEAAAAVGLGDSRAVEVVVRPAVGHATLRVRWLDRVATDELIAALTVRLTDAPVAARSAAGAWYTATACGLLGGTVACYLRYFVLVRLF